MQSAVGANCEAGHQTSGDGEQRKEGEPDGGQRPITSRIRRRRRLHSRRSSDDADEMCGDSRPVDESTASAEIFQQSLTELGELHNGRRCRRNSAGRRRVATVAVVVGDRRKGELSNRTDDASSHSGDQCRRYNTADAVVFDDILLRRLPINVLHGGSGGGGGGCEIHRPLMQHRR